MMRSVLLLALTLLAVLSLTGPAPAQSFTMRIGFNPSAVPDETDVDERFLHGYPVAILYVDNAIPSTSEQRSATMLRHRAELAAMATIDPEVIGFPIPSGFTYDRSATIAAVTHYRHHLQGKTYIFRGCAMPWLYRGYVRGFRSELVRTHRAVTVDEDPGGPRGCPSGENAVSILVYVADDAPRGMIAPTDFGAVDFLDVARRAAANPPTAQQIGLPVLPGSRILPVATAEVAVERRLSNTSSSGYAGVFYRCNIAENESDDFYAEAYAQYGSGQVYVWEDYDNDGLCGADASRAWVGFAMLTRAPPTSDYPFR